jgi:hypothetical protein
MALYKKVNDSDGNWDCIQNTETKAFIPKDEANTDYQEYLKWVAKGNTPEEADET